MKPNTNRQTRRRFLKTSGSALAVVGTAGLSTTVAAESVPPQGIFADGVTDVEPDWPAFASGLTARFTSGFGPPETVSTYADRMRNEFNANTDAWVDYGNWLASEFDVTALGSVTLGVDVSITRRRWPTRNETVSTTIEAVYDDGLDAYSDLDWQPEPIDNPDYQIEIQNAAAENAADELQEFRREFIDDGHEVPDSAYLNELAGKYAFDLAVGENSRTVLQTFIGDSDV